MSRSVLSRAIACGFGCAVAMLSSSTLAQSAPDDRLEAPAVRPFGLDTTGVSDDAEQVSPLFLQAIMNPGDKAADRARNVAATQEADPRRPGNPFAGRMPSYEMPAVNVTGEALGAFREEDKIGPYGQPRWTARRFTPGTRVYVRPPGVVEFEYWLRPTIEKDGNTEIRTLYEIGIGLPYRFQVDFYLRTDSGGDGEETKVGQQLEVRWAVADWGKIWGNPTLYFEWVQKDADPDQFEFKLLLGDELTPRWHWGVNLVAEMELGGEREYEYQVTGGVTYAVIDSVLSLGLEAQWLFADVKEDRGNFSHTVFVGPTIQWRPIEPLRIAFSPLVGVTDDSPDFRAFLNVGWEF
ncbi:hypothetical protein [Humisphaera borealis]|uniref:Transporter n=1 Tax=Humisphaera borealis TaxID=2807512 RepID=A0A7M2WSV9_9BACT|nr:hypothetical protein [Humisphaera borealis]QOV88587.1 hypothetical protein IPV69_20435 [Humisphaera borealis]